MEPTIKLLEDRVHEVIERLRSLREERSGPEVDLDSMRRGGVATEREQQKLSEGVSAGERDRRLRDVAAALQKAIEELRED
jgi:hypothetical protein